MQSNSAAGVSRAFSFPETDMSIDDWDWVRSCVCVWGGQHECTLWTCATPLRTNELRSNEERGNSLLPATGAEPR
jgi:hypothetical protein